MSGIVLRLEHSIQCPTWEGWGLDLPLTVCLFLISYMGEFVRIDDLVRDDCWGRFSLSFFSGRLGKSLQPHSCPLSKSSCVL